MNISEKIMRAKTDYDEVYKAGKQAEYDAFWDDFQQNGTRTGYTYGFYNWGDISLKPKYKIQPTEASNIFQGCRMKGDFTERAEVDFSQAISVSYAFAHCANITRIGIVDCRSVSTGHITLVLQCGALETIDEIILKDDGTQFNAGTEWTFRDCFRLKNVKITGKIPFNTNFQSSPLSKKSITSVINALWEDASGKTVIFNRLAVNTAFETSEGALDGSTSAEWQALAATKPNWTIELA